LWPKNGRIKKIANNIMMKIGVTGTLGAGKDTLADYLVSKGFEHISLSDLLREELKKIGQEITRENLVKAGNEMREREGDGVLAKRAIELMDEKKDYVVTSIRNPLEVKTLAGSGKFVLLSVDAAAELRFERIVARGRKEKDAKTFEEFKEAEAREMKSENKSGQQIRACMNMAKFTIVNDAGREAYFKKIDGLMPHLEKEAQHIRPDWDRYFMDLVSSVGKRGTCNRGRAGCLVVKDKRIIATGYVGAPPKLAHCDDVGHWFKKTIHEDGSVTQHCIRTVHAEANAIAQAAKYGIAIDGATLYCKIEPCLDCTKLLISAGIKRVVCENRYHAAKEAREMLEEAGVEVESLNEKVELYGSK
jgi:dCMP deaminase